MASLSQGKFQYGNKVKGKARQLQDTGYSIRGFLVEGPTGFWQSVLLRAGWCLCVGCIFPTQLSCLLPPLGWSLGVTFVAAESEPEPKTSFLIPTAEG